MTWVAIGGWLAASYLAGAIPTSYIVGKVFRGIDLRQVGSRNLGATNLYRTLGWKFAIPVGLFDVAKGAVPVAVFGSQVASVNLFPVYCGVAAVLGHVFSVFVGFKGGKGVATAAGMILALAPLALLAVTAVWVLTVWLTGYVSLGSVLGAVLFPVAAELLHPGRPEPLWFDVLLAAFLVVKHRSNIRRLLAGTENRFGSRGRPAPDGFLMTTVAVLGAGSWGTTLANLLAKKGQGVRLWAYEPEVVEAINREHRNPVFLPAVALAPGLRAFSDPREALERSDVVLSVIPSHAVRSVVSRLAGTLRPATLVVSATKGIEPDSLALMSQVLGAELPSARVAVLSGPSFAEEVCQDQPTAVVAASADGATAEEVQKIFATSRFRVYSNRDVVGVELGGALKNVIAIAAGILEGLGLGNNPRAALVTRGLAEMTRLGVAMGADPLTFAGLAGMGDLILTTTGALSRNRALGIALAKGETLGAYTAAHRTVAEGVNTARAALQLARKHGVELPITEQVAAVLFDGKSPQQGVTDLMERTLKPELWR